MTWRKQLDIAGSDPLVITADPAEIGRYPVTLSTRDGIILALTLNQAGDLAHAIEEAIRKAQEQQ